MQEPSPIQLEHTRKRTRRTHSKAFKAKLVALAQAGNLSVAQIAMDNKINANQLRKWMNESQRVVPTETKMIPVSVAQESFTQNTMVMELIFNACAIKIHHSWDPIAIGKLVKALR